MRESRTRGSAAGIRGFRSAKLAACAGLALALVSAGCATAHRKPLLTPEQRQLNLESFDYVWTTIHEKYWDPEFGGLDWQALRDELRPRVEQAATVSEARAVMQDMVSRLGVSHFSIIPAQAYAAIEQPSGAGSRDGETGMDVRVLDGQAVVTSVAAGSPAAEAGVRPGWVIVRIGDDAIPPKLQVVAEEFKDKTYQDYILASVATWRLHGRVGNTVAVGFLDGDDKAIDVDIVLAEKRGRKVRLGHLPPAYVWIDVERIDENIGYIAFNHFLDPVHVMPVFNDAMMSFMDADGIVIDLRGNGGGLGAMAMGMAGWLVAEKNRHLGTLYLRDNELKLIVIPRPTTYHGPVAVLVDGLSVSAAEFFAGGLQDLGRACIIGTRTAGAALPSAIEKLPNADGFQYVFANYVSAGGEVLEGGGVSPELDVGPTRQALLEGRDPALEAAITWIRSQ
jgi:carboxyl-terminal processing protease